MKNQTTKLIIGSSFALVLAIGFPLQAQAAAKNEMDSKMLEHCQEMKVQKQKLRDDLKAQNAALTEQLGKMNSAPDDKKISQMAAVINLMAEQRIAVDEQKAKLEEGMMLHMQAMQTSGKSMMQCPMMMDMKDMKK